MEQIYVGIDLHFLSSPLPLKIKGFLREDRGNYYIVINSNISQEEQKKTIAHEIDHLVNDDFNSEENVKDIENKRRIT